MIITNKYNLPDRIIRQIELPYQPKEKRFSVTSLIDSPRIRTLQLKEWDRITLDYSDFLETIIGLSVHQRIERLSSEEEDEISEQKFEDLVDGVLVVGRTDNYSIKKKIIRETKVKAVGCLDYESFMKELTAQLNIYAWQRRNHGGEVLGLEADIYYRDWKEWEAERDKEKWAVMKPGRKTAIKLFDTEAEAVYYIKDHVYGGYVEHRKKGKYPPISISFSTPITLWTPEEADIFVKDEVEFHALAPMECPEENRWKNELRCSKYCRVRSVCPLSPCYLGN